MAFACDPIGRLASHAGIRTIDRKMVERIVQAQLASVGSIQIMFAVPSTLHIIINIVFNLVHGQITQFIVYVLDPVLKFVIVVHGLFFILQLILSPTPNFTVRRLPTVIADPTHALVV